MKKALVFFNEFLPSLGGSEYLALTVVKALQRSYDVTLAVKDCEGDVRQLTAAYGVDVDWARVTFVRLRPTGLLAVLDRHLRIVCPRRLKRMGPRFDLCISCSNPVDFGRPGFHFVFMLSFDHRFYVWARQRRESRLRQWLVTFKDVALSRLAGIRTPRQILADPAETVFPNSNFARERIETFYRCRTADAFYPPTLFESDRANVADRCQIGCLGRICPEKRTLEAVEIVRRARERTGRPLILHIAGTLTEDAYCATLRRLAQESPWIVLHGPVSGEAKRRFLSSVALALHCRRAEEFGIAVTEYLKAGVVPVVPSEGGAREVVDDASLGFADDDEAVDILSRLCTDDAFYARCREKGAERAKAFSAAGYWERQDDVLGRLCLTDRTQKARCSYLIVTPFFPTASCWRGAYCLDFAKALRKRLPSEKAVAVFVPWPGDYEIGGVRVFGFREWRLPGSVFPFLFAAHNRRAFLKAVARAGVRLADVDVCHGHTARCAIYPLAVKARNPSCRTILHHHDLMGFGLCLGRLRHNWFNNVLQFPYLRRLHERMDLHVFVSEKARQSLLSAPDATWTDSADYRRQMRGLGFFRPAKLRQAYVLHNGVDKTLFRPDGRTAQRSGTFTIGCIGNFVDGKDQLVLLKAAVILKGVRLRLVGTGPSLARCRLFAEEHRLDAEFVEELRREDLPSFYRSLDLFALPSTFEGFGCVFTEAHACGVPFITCEGQGMDDLIPSEDRDKWLCRPHDPEDLAKKIRAFAECRWEQRLTEEQDIDCLVERFVQSCL